MDLKIKGRTAVVTGGDSGMGLATAKLLAHGGVNIVLSDKTHEELEGATEEDRGHAKERASVTAVSAEVTKNEDVLGLAAQATAIGPAPAPARARRSLPRSCAGEAHAWIATETNPTIKRPVARERPPTLAPRSLHTRLHRFHLHQEGHAHAGRTTTDLC